MFHSMETIQVVLDPKLLRETDEAAKGARVNRSELIRRALREHLERIHARDLEARDRRGYREHPDSCTEIGAWERVAAWPDR
jgi:metal-responsive CopG/Arc/MetJ family transcriptional regulator